MSGVTRRVRVACALALVLGGAMVQPACARQAPAGDPAELFRTGQYDEAIAALGDPQDAASRRLLVRVLMETGRYEDAERAALQGAGVESVPVDLANVAGEALYARGRREDAERAFARAAAAAGPERLRARMNQAVSMWERGDRAGALALFDTFIDAYNAGEAVTSQDLSAVGVAVTYLGVTDPQLFHDAVKALGEASAADPRDPEPRLLLGELFLAKYSSTEASVSFREVLEINPKHPRALLGLARARAFDGTDEALVFADASLLVNSTSPAARAFRGRLLLGLEDYAGAVREAELALASNPSSLEALAVLGAARFLSGDDGGYEGAKQRALGINPKWGDFDVTVAELAVQHRRYREALRLARAGLALDSANYSARALVGLTELRLGNVEEAQQQLDIAFAGDPYNVWVKNTLDLLDTYPQYVTRKTPRFELFLHQDEADVLEIYMAELAEESLSDLVQRYGAEPTLPVRVEVYPSHADFSVRTVGLAGLGALGVAFGNILALDSPAARETGAFNWGSTLWHEIAHAVTLGVSGNRVPRWLTEGISVLEERRARDGWGAGVSMSFLVALKQGLLLPVSELNTGFVRPSYPEQIMHAYYQASLVAEMIEEERGARALRDMLRAYERGATTEQVFRDVVRSELPGFDARFDAWMRQRFTRQLAAIDVPPAVPAPPSAGARGRGAPPVQVGGAFFDELGAAHTAFRAERLDDARAHAERAAAMIPEYAEQDGPHLLLQRVHLQRGDTSAATVALEAHVRHNESDYASHITLADLHRQAGNAARAAEILERAMYINPYDAAVHTTLAELYGTNGNHAGAVRERRALLALRPVNLAEAHYRLAAALLAAGDRAAARSTVLRALEIAPNYTEAQELLLRLRGGN